METLLGRGRAFVDRIYYCPHHPHSGFPGERMELKMECDCRKPRTGMIERALQEFNGAREISWLVGDSSVDIETARRAHVKSVLVETGYAGMDYREWATPDAIVPDLPAAVSYILDYYPRFLSYCKQLADGLDAGAIVLIGGKARSGKSTFAGVLRDALLARGQHAVVVSIDRWLRDEVKREPGVMGRYDIAELQALVERLQDRERGPLRLALPGYHKLNRKQISAVESLSLTGTDVVLLEGTIALGLKLSNTTEVHRYHIEMDERLRMSRVLREYRLRGASEQAALAIYASRQQDESPFLERLGLDAIRISLTDILK
jgi:uridine kinase